LQKYIGDRLAEIAESKSRKQAFLLTCYYIRQLGSYLRAAKVLVVASLRIPALFDDFAIWTQPSPRLLLLSPLTDYLTTLERILKRILPKGSGEMALY
jgi:hypothetical protein